MILVYGWFGSGENGEEIAARLRRDLLPTLLSGVMYWPACDFITFKFIPVHLQVNTDLCICFQILFHFFLSISCCYY